MYEEYFVSLQSQNTIYMRKFFRTILFIINILFAVALVLSTLAGTLPPSRFAAVSILSYGYLLLLAANVVFVVVWLCLSRWEFLLSVAAIAVRFSFVGLFFQMGGSTEAEPAEGQLKVMTFNTHGFRGLDSDTVMTADAGAREFLRLVDEEQPDVLCLQEFYNPPHVKVTDSLAARGYAAHYGVHGGRAYSAAILFTRCQLVEGYEMDRRSKFYADLRKEGRTVRVCVVHGDSYRLSDEDMEGFEKLTHAKPDSTTCGLLAKFVETTRQHEEEWKEELLPLIEATELPLVVAGDFNDTPASYIYQKIAGHLTDPYVEEGCGFGTTYHGPYPAFRIDYVFHSPELQTLSYKRIKTDISDHYPIIVTLAL